MVVVTFTIPDGRIQEVIDAMKWYRQIPKNEETDKFLFTDSEWAKECIKNFVKETVGNHKRQKMNEEADFGLEGIVE